MGGTAGAQAHDHLANAVFPQAQALQDLEGAAAVSGKQAQKQMLRPHLEVVHLTGQLFCAAEDALRLWCKPLPIPFHDYLCQPGDRLDDTTFWPRNPPLFVTSALETPGLGQGCLGLEETQGQAVAFRLDADDL